MDWGKKKKQEEADRMASPAASFAFKLQDATVDAERLGEHFLINREQVRRGARRRGEERGTLFGARDARRRQRRRPMLTFYKHPLPPLSERKQKTTTRR